jgi:predicted lipoprotein with Yx(FWY)xxD motif
LAGIAVGAAALVGACGTTSGTPRAAVAGPVAVVDPAKLAAVQSTTLGPIVTDAKAMTLYLYTKDSQSPPTSHCYGTCATEWPPALVPASGNVQLAGVPQAEVGTVTRTDGTKQLTINNWPVYEYAGDKRPGDVNGQGVGHVWYAITPAGTKATTGATAATATTEQAGGAGANNGSTGYGAGYSSGY